MSAPLVEHAPAKVNLSLRVLGRRRDGYHELESLVVFADFGDRLSFRPGHDLALTVQGEHAGAAGGGDDNLVLKAARALLARRSGTVRGAFDLEKRLPVAAGLGGGSSDAAAALRLLARASGMGQGESVLHEAARATGADVPVCLDPQPRIMRGVGDILSLPLRLPPLPAVLVNPRVALSTKSVFERWSGATPLPRLGASEIERADSVDAVVGVIGPQANDLEPPAIALEPVIAEVLAALRPLDRCRLARMSGSGATCFGLFASVGEADAAAAVLRRHRPEWWIQPCTLGG